MSENGKDRNQADFEIQEEGEIRSGNKNLIKIHNRKKSSNSSLSEYSRRHKKKSRRERKSHRKESSSSSRSWKRHHDSRKEKAHKRHRSRTRSRQREDKKKSHNQDINKINQSRINSQPHEEKQTDKQPSTLDEEIEEIFVSSEQDKQEDLKQKREERQKRISYIKQSSGQTCEEKSPFHEKKEEFSDIKYSMTDEDRTKLLHLLAEEREKATIATTANIKPFKEETDDHDMFAETPTDNLKIDKKILLTQDQENSGYYTPEVNEIINGHYKIIGFCGKGIFSNVVRVVDINTNKEFAIKIIRSIDIMLMSGEKERSTLKRLNEIDKNDKSNIVRLVDSFDFKKHLCMVFELYDMNLRDLLKFRGQKGLPLSTVRIFAQQLLYAFDLIHKYKIIHADFKPDNTIVNKKVDRVRLCDFGSSLLEDEVVTTCELVSRFYRAPEIILGHPYDSKVDIWSLGCTLFEIFTGQILFQGRSNNEMLKLIMQVKGPIPSRIIKKGLYSGQYFNDQGDFLSMEVDYSNKKEYMKDLKVSSFPSKDLMSILKNFSSSEDLKSLLSFKDFLEKCLHLDPKKRVTALEALTHEFIGIIPIGSYSK